MIDLIRIAKKHRWQKSLIEDRKKKIRLMSKTTTSLSQNSWISSPLDRIPNSSKGIEELPQANNYYKIMKKVYIYL